MNSSDSLVALSHCVPRAPEADAVLASEAGIPFDPSQGRASAMDPFVEWLSLMEVVYMLCPVWPVRDQPMRGDQWRL